MNSVSAFPTSLNDRSSKLPLLYVEERDGHIAALVFRGEARHVDRILKMWASGKFAPDDAESHTAAARSSLHRHWYAVRLTD